MQTDVVLLLSAIAVSFLSTAATIRFCTARGFLDRPDGIRKLHARCVPALGGLPLAFSAGVALLGTAAAASWFPLRGSAVSAVVPAVILVLGMGIVDDLKRMHWKFKLAFQVAAASYVWYQGLAFPWSAGSGEAASGIGSYLLTLFWVVGVTNALNLIDGLDGLAAGVALLSSLAFLAAGIVSGNPMLTIMMLALAGALLGFLPHNSSPAKIFLGDSGSNTVGILLAVAGLMYLRDRGSFSALAMPVMALGVPLADTSVAIARRFIRGVSPFAADRGHLHHRLLDIGYSPRAAVLFLHALSFCFAALAVVSLFVSGIASILVGAFFLAAVVGTIWWLDYDEFRISAAVSAAATRLPAVTPRATK